MPPAVQHIPNKDDIVFNNSTMDIIFASGGSTNLGKRMYNFQKSILDVVLASGGSKNLRTHKKICFTWTALAFLEEEKEEEGEEEEEEEEEG